MSPATRQSLGDYPEAMPERSLCKNSILPEPLRCGLESMVPYVLLGVLFPDFIRATCRYMVGWIYSGCFLSSLVREKKILQGYSCAVVSHLEPRRLINRYAIQYPHFRYNKETAQCFPWLSTPTGRVEDVGCHFPVRWVRSYLIGGDYLVFFLSFLKGKLIFVQYFLYLCSTIATP